MDFKQTIDGFVKGAKEFAEATQETMEDLHDNYISKIVPDFGKFGDTAKFLAEMAPGISEYNAIREGDWQAFAIAAGVDIAAVAAGAFTAGAGYAAVKGGSGIAKAGVKVAVKEVAEAGTKKAIKEVAEASTEKVIKAVAEAGTEKIVKETVEAGTKKAIKETVETGAEGAIKKTVENSVEKTVKESTEAGFEKAAKEMMEDGAEKALKETTETAAEKADKAVSQIVQNKLDGIAKEEKALEMLLSKFGKENILREQYIRDSAGNVIKDIVTGEARRIDFIVTKGEKVLQSIEVTSKTAPKELQMAKELRILEQARKMGGAFIKDSKTGKMYEIANDVITDIWRLE